MEQGGPHFTHVEACGGRAGSIHRSMRASIAARIAGSGATHAGRSRSSRRRRRACHGRWRPCRVPRSPAAVRRCSRPAARCLGPRETWDRRHVCIMRQMPPDIAAGRKIGHQVGRHREPLVAAPARQDHPRPLAARHPRKVHVGRRPDVPHRLRPAGAQLQRGGQQPLGPDASSSGPAAAATRAAAPRRSGWPPRCWRRPERPVTAPGAARAPPPA